MWKELWGLIKSSGHGCSMLPACDTAVLWLQYVSYVPPPCRTSWKVWRAQAGWSTSKLFWMQASSSPRSVWRLIPVCLTTALNIGLGVCVCVCCILYVLSACVRTLASYEVHLAKTNSVVWYICPEISALGYPPRYKWGGWNNRNTCHITQYNNNKTICLLLCYRTYLDSTFCQAALVKYLRLHIKQTVTFWIILKGAIKIQSALLASG